MAANNRTRLRQAFALTLPVFFGYLFLGSAFGLLLHEAGYGPLWALLCSVLIYAGSLQFILVSFLGTATSLLTVATVTLSLNSRHLFYGLSFIERFRETGKLRPYLIFALTDETYALYCSLRERDLYQSDAFLLLTAVLNQLYWVAGSLLGNLLGHWGRFNTQGIDFAMTALFVVILTDQIQQLPDRRPILIGLGCGLAALLLLGPDRFILPALAAAVLLILPLLRRQRLEAG